MTGAERSRLWARKNMPKVIASTVRWRRANREHYLSSCRKAYARRREILLARARKYREKNPDKIKAICRKYYASHSDLRRAKAKQYYHANLQKCRERNKAWRNKNLIQVRLKARQKTKTPEAKKIRCIKLRERRRRDPSFRIEQICRSRIRKALKRGEKRMRVSHLLGCSTEEFRKYLETQFLPGMYWNNHGRVWEIDHIIPCAAFDLSKSSHRKYCFHFSNHRPLWSRDNRIKRARVTPDQRKLIEAL